MGKARIATSKNETSANAALNSRSQPSNVSNIIASQQRQQQQQHQPPSHSANLSRKKQPNVASAGLAFLVAGGYTPLPLSTSGFEGSSLGVNHYSVSGTAVVVVGGATSPAPLTEIGTSWSTRWESCQMMREQNVMMMNANKKQLPTMGEAKIDWNLLIRLRNWVAGVILNQQSRRNDEANNNKNTKEAVRCLLLGVPFSGSILADEGFSADSNRQGENGLIELNTTSESCANKTASNNSVLSKKEQAEQQQKRLELIAETEDWNLLLDAAKEQIVNVLDPFLEKHLLLKKKSDGEGDDKEVNQD